MREPSLPDRFFKRDEILDRKVLECEVIVFNGSRGSSGDRVRIDVAGHTKVVLRSLSSNLSGYNTICLIAYNEGDSPVRVGLRLIHRSKTLRSDMNDFSTTGDREIVVPGTRREIKFHRECFGTYGLGNEWEDILEIEVNIAFEWGKPKGAPFPVYLEGFFLEARRVPPGPRLTKEGLANDALGEGTIQSLCLPQGIGPFNEKNPALLIPPPHPYRLEKPEAILDGCIMGKKLLLPFSWDTRAVTELEWEHFLHRYHFMRQLIRHIADTGSVEAVKWIDSAIRCWVSEFPVPLDANGGASPAWETLSVAWRIREWLWILGIVWKCPVFKADTRILMMASFWESAQSLMQHKGHPNNWLVVESGALALLGLCLNQFRDADKWLSEGLERLCTEMDSQFFEDGVHFELSPMYHAICMGILLDLKYAASWYNKPLPENIPRVLRKGMEYLGALMRPDHTWPAINDSGGFRGDYIALMEYADVCFGQSHNLTSSENQRESYLAARCQTFSDAGITIISSDQLEGSTYLLFRSGPSGASHIHRDVLSLELYALGTSWLVDPGITSYAPYQSTSYYRSARSHNSILIDGCEPRPDLQHFNKRIRGGRQDTFSLFGEDIHIVSGIYRGPWDRLTDKVTWIRSVICVKNGEYFLVLDEVFGFGSHVVTTGWQFAPVTVHYVEETKSIIAEDNSGKGTLKIKPLTPHEVIEIHIACGSRQPWEGWVSMEGSDLPAPHCRCDIETDFPARILWLLLPIHPGCTSEMTCQCSNHAASSNIKIEICDPDNYKDVIIIGLHDRSTDQRLRWHDGTYVSFRRLHRCDRNASKDSCTNGALF